MLRSQLCQHAPTMETTQREEKMKKGKKVEIFAGASKKLLPQKVDTAQLVLDRDVVNEELLIHDPVTDREVFASTAVAVLPC